MVKAKFLPAPYKTLDYPHQFHLQDCQGQLVLRFTSPEFSFSYFGSSYHFTFLLIATLLLLLHLHVLLLSVMLSSAGFLGRPRIKKMLKTILSPIV